MEKPEVIKRTPEVPLIEKVDKCIGLGISILSRIDQVEGVLFGYLSIPDRTVKDEVVKAESSIDERINDLIKLLHGSLESLDRILEKTRG